MQVNQNFNQRIKKSIQKTGNKMLEIFFLENKITVDDLEGLLKEIKSEEDKIRAARRFATNYLSKGED